jgi:hypothetical protein
MPPKRRRPTVRIQPPDAKRHDLVARLGRRGHERHRGRRDARAEPRHAGDLAPAHRAGDVEREHHAAAGRLDGLERRVERGVERVDDRRERLPHPAPARASAGRVRPQGGEDRDRVQPRAADPLRVPEPL